MTWTHRARVVAILIVGASGVAAAETPDAGEAALATLERSFGQVPKAEFLASLDGVPRDFGASPAAPRALVWRAQLAAFGGDEATAIDRYRRVIVQYPSSPSVSLALRGLGDIAFRAHDFADADALYSRALDHADPVLSAELVDKRGLVAKWRARYRLFVGALAAHAVIALLLLFRIARGKGALRFPVELAYAAPVVFLIVGAARLYAREAFSTIAIAGAVGLVLFGLSGLATERDPPRNRRDVALGTLAIVVAVLALGYVAVYAGGLTDKVVDTLAGAQD